MTSQGLKIIQSNVALADGEIDLLAADGGVLIAVEVRTTSGGTDPIDAVDETKRARVKRLASGVGAARSDFLGIRLTDGGVDIHWVQN